MVKMANCAIRSGFIAVFTSVGLPGAATAENFWGTQYFGNAQFAATGNHELFLGVSCDFRDYVFIGEGAFTLGDAGENPRGYIAVNGFLAEFKISYRGVKEFDFFEGPSFELHFGDDDAASLLEALANGARARIEFEDNHQHIGPITLSLRGSKVALYNACALW